MYYVQCKAQVTLHNDNDTITSGIFSSTLVYYRFSEEDRVSFGGRTLKYFVVRGAHSKIFLEGCKIFRDPLFMCLHFGRGRKVLKL